MQPALVPMRLRSAAGRTKRGRRAPTARNDQGVGVGDNDDDTVTENPTDRSRRLAKRIRGAAERGDPEARDGDRDGKDAPRGGGSGGDGNTDAETSDERTGSAERKDVMASVGGTAVASTDGGVSHRAPPMTFVDWVERIRFVSERVAEPQMRRALQDYGCRNAGAHVDAYLREYERTSRVQTVQGECEDCETEVEFEAEFEQDRVRFPPQYQATDEEDADIGRRIGERVDRVTTALTRRMLVKEIRAKYRRADTRYLLRPLMLEFEARAPRSAVCDHLMLRSRTFWRREWAAFSRTVVDEWHNRSHATPLDARMCAATFALMCRQFVCETDLFALACLNRATWRYVRTRAFTSSGANLSDRYTRRCSAVDAWLQQSARRRYALVYGEADPAATPSSSDDTIVRGEQPGVREVLVAHSIGAIRFPDAESIGFWSSVHGAAPTLAGVAPQPLRHIGLAMHERGASQIAGEARWASGPAYEMKALRFAYLHCRETVEWDELTRAAVVNGCRHMVIDHAPYDHERFRAATYLADFANCTTERRHAAILRQCKIIVRRHRGDVSLNEWHSNSVGWHERRTLYAELERDFETRAVVGVPLWIDVADPRVSSPPPPPPRAAAAVTQT